MFSRWFRRAPALTRNSNTELARYRAMTEAGLSTALHRQRIVVVDVETSGLDPARDALLAIGAVAIEDGVIRLEQSLEVFLRQDHASADPNILVHGISGSAQLGASDPEQALITFLSFARKNPLVAYNADFDRIAIERAVRSVLGVRLKNLWLDLALLAPALDAGHAAADTLDEWLRVYGIANYSRHNALADAVSTAELFLAQLSRAHARGLQ
ncbi:MAG TPA: 3'-5' exonuclease, partial [Burkholderiales bacterium]|nr:3'-5' exonuclease [Burkholderiales bacterium]